MTTASRNGVGGFTLMELIIVVAIAMILMGLSFAAFTILKRQAMRRNTAMACKTIALAIASYNSGGALQFGGGKGYSAWDWNNDQIIDGRPIDDPGFSATARTDAAAGGYTGMASMLRLDLPAAFVSPATGRITDAWRRDMHIAWAVGIYDGESYGIWSDGEDPSKPASRIASWGKP